MYNIFKIQTIHAFILLFYSIVTFIGCSDDKEQTQETLKTDKALSSTSSKLTESDTIKYQSLNKPETLRGVVYVSKAFSSSHLALESESGKIYLIIGKKQGALSNLRNRKVEVWGYIHKSEDNEVGRDSVEVIHFEVIHGEGD